MPRAFSSDSFDQAVRLNLDGDIALSEEMQQRGIRLLTSVRTSVFYMGFNFLDPVVGGKDEADEARAHVPLHAWARSLVRTFPCVLGNLP